MTKFSKRHEEIINTWFEWMMSGVFVVDSDDGVEWGERVTDDDKILHNLISNELDGRRSKYWKPLWEEAIRRYREVPLIKALS